MSKSFVPQLLLQLVNQSQLQMPFDSLPRSYQKQPYNLAAKVLSRGGIKVNIHFNEGKNVFIITRIRNHEPDKN